ncbi:MULTISPECIES: VOC family protein [unclassified Pseudomonas]|uniref:VOC family protein n=1 Tax=unclassified Pseudomonas TaxID=196821 RepID=UPI0030DB902E
MIKPNFFILYVDSPETSARFYADLLGDSPVEASPTFAMFALDSGFMLGLWSRHTVEPGVKEVGTAGEVAFCVTEKNVVDLTYEAWIAKGLKVIQSPMDMEFGYTFVALDPDGHRLRVFVPSDN